MSGDAYDGTSSFVNKFGWLFNPPVGQAVSRVERENDKGRVRMPSTLIEIVKASCKYSVRDGAHVIAVPSEIPT
jgi:hypothetical protein